MNSLRTSGMTAERRVIATFALCAVIGVVLLAASLWYSLERWQLAHARTHLEPQAKALAMLVDREMIEAQRDLVFLSRMPVFQQLPYVDRIDRSLNGVPENVDIEKRQLLVQLLNQAERFTVLYVLRPNADLYLVEPFRLQPTLTQYNLSDRPYYREAVRTKAVVVSDSYLGADGVLAVAILAPILADSGEVAAYLGGAFHLSRLSQVVSEERIRPFAAGFIVDGKGRLIAHTNPALLTGDVRERFAQSPFVSEIMGQSPGEDTDGGHGVRTGEGTDPSDGRRYLTAVIPLRSGWRLGLMLQRAGLLADLRPIIWRTVLLTAALFLLISGIGIMFAERIGRRWHAAERALRASEESLQANRERLVEAQTMARLGSWEWDAAKDVITGSDEFYRLFGVSPDQIRTFQAFVDLLHPADRERVRREVQESLTKKALFDTEYRVCLPGGDYRYIHARGQLFIDAAGKNVRLAGTCLDISERKQAESELKRIEWMLSAEVSSGMDGRRDPSAGQGYGDLTKLNRAGLIVRSLSQETLRDITSEYLNLLETSSAIYERNGDYAFGIFSSQWCRRLDRASRNLCGTDDNAAALASGKWLCHESCWTCCSKEAVAKQEPVDIECSGGIRLYAVPIFAGEEVVGSINFGYGSPPKDPAKLRALAELYRVDGEELVREAAAYDTRPPHIIEMAKHRLQASARLIGVLVDRQRAEEKLKRVMSDLERSNRDLEQFAYVASHDLQEPLRMISSYTQLLAQHYEGHLDGKAKKYIDYAVDGAIRMQQLIGDLLTYSRIGTRGKPPELTDAHAVLGKTLSDLAALIKENQALVTNDNLPTVRADPSQLAAVFQNLIANAIKFRGKNMPRVHVSARESDDGYEWVFSVKDNGIGIEPRYQDRLFIIFRRLHTQKEYPGTGIGLALCKRIVERHGGRIWFESEPGNGATFYFTIPK